MVLKIYYKFNSIAFTTRFNLVLVWSKTVQISLKSHPNGSGITRSPGLVQKEVEPLHVDLMVLYLVLKPLTGIHSNAGA